MELKLILKKVIHPEKEGSKITEELSETEQQQLVKAVGMIHELPFDFTVEQLFDENYESEDDDFGTMECCRKSPVEFWDIYSGDKAIQQLIIFGKQEGYMFEANTLNIVFESGLLGDSYFEAENNEQIELCKALAIAREDAIKTNPQSRLAELDFFVLDEEDGW